MPWFCRLGVEVPDGSSVAVGQSTRCSSTLKHRLCQDLSRRLASEKLLGGQEPGATEALELLLNAILMKLEMEEPGEEDGMIHGGTSQLSPSNGEFYTFLMGKSWDTRRFEAMQLMDMIIFFKGGCG